MYIFCANEIFFSTVLDIKVDFKVKKKKKLKKNWLLTGKKIRKAKNKITAVYLKSRARRKSFLAALRQPCLASGLLATDGPCRCQSHPLNPEKYEVGTYSRIGLDIILVTYLGGLSAPTEYLPPYALSSRWHLLKVPSKAVLGFIHKA